MDDPYDYQIRLLEALLAGKNVILVTPTGSGKTYGAYLPFFQSRAYGDGLLPEKMFHIVPMRVLATQALSTCQELREQLNPDLFQELTAIYQRFMPDFLSIQTGESPDDPQFEAMIIVCTIDQALASALGIPYSLGTKLGNINVGAVCSSYLILDEPHLYPLSNDGKSHEGAFTTSLELLRLTRDLSRFVFMSATMSRPLVERLSEILDAVIITVDDTELVELNKGRSRTFERALQPMSAEHILDLHDRCSLVVCNTVQRAQETYLQLSQANGAMRSTQLPHLAALEGCISSSNGAIPAPLLSPLMGGRDERFAYREQMHTIAAAFNGSKTPPPIVLIDFNSLADFAQNMRKLIDAIPLAQEQGK